MGECLRDVIEFYLGLGPKMSKSKNLKFDKAKSRNRYFTNLPLFDDLDWMEIDRPKKTEVLECLKGKDKSKNDEVFNSIVKVLDLRRQKELLKKLENQKFSIDNIKIIQPLNISSQYEFAQSHLWDFKNDVLITPDRMTSEGLEKYVYATLEDKEAAKNFINSMLLPAIIFYDPTQKFGMHEDDQTGLKRFNTSCPQPWKKLDPLDETPQDFEEFINFFIPNEDERLEVLQWLYSAAFNKNHYALVLCGVKGTGKGIFSTLAKRITAGSSLEAFDAPESMGSFSHFNSSLLNARLCVFDEITINSKNKDRLKRLMNDFATLEGKGVDAQKNVKLWANFIISNNFPLENNLEWDDRRFLVPDLTQVKIEKEWGTEKIDSLLEKIEHSDQFICDVVHYIKSKIKYFRPKTNPLRTNLFYKIVYFSLTPWQKSLLDFPFKTVEKKDDGYSMVELRSFHKMHFKNSDDQDTSKRFPQNQTVSQFLENYRHGKSQIKVATFKPLPNKESKIFYTEEFLNTKGEF